MTYELNLLLIVVLLVAVAILFVIYFLSKRKNPTLSEKNQDDRKFDLATIMQHVKEQINYINNLNLYNLGLSEEEFLRQSRRSNELRDALKKCNTGDYNSKIYVKDFMVEVLFKDYGFTHENIEQVIPFNQPDKMTGQDVFETLMYLYRKKHKGLGLSTMLKEYKLLNPKEDGGYRITEDEIRLIYRKIVKILSLEDKVRILTQRVYEYYKGFGVIDELRDMKIDGVSGGVSGMPPRLDNLDDEQLLINGMVQQQFSSFNSVWFMFEGKTIHLPFLTFGTEAELRRVTQNVYKYNYPGQLSESRPYMVNEMADGSRVVVVRPKFAESWAFFIRKFDTATVDIHQLITHQNKELAINVMKYLIAGNRSTAVTGSQGSGKTTLLMALVQYIHKTLTLRIQETAFELNLRKLFPDRNILSFQETDTVSGQDGLDLQKKTDGSVNIIGEVATDPVAAWMIQSAQVASLFTLFSHHAKTLSDLVYALRNSLLKTGMFSNESVAEQQVVSVLEFDIHLRRDYDGTRYIERITECIPVDKSLDAATKENEYVQKLSKEEQFYHEATQFFRQSTQRRQFVQKNIVEYRSGSYVAVNPISKERQKEILNHLPESMRIEFNQFIETTTWEEEIA